MGLIRPITLWPFPVKAFEKASNAKLFVSTEINILGQMVDDIRLAIRDRVPVKHYGSIFEIPEPEDILKCVNKWLDREVV